MKFSVRVFLSEIASHRTTWGSVFTPLYSSFLPQRTFSAIPFSPFTLQGFKYQIERVVFTCVLQYSICYAHHIALHTLLVIIYFAFTVYTLWIINCPVRYCLCICTYCLCIPNVSSIFVQMTSHELRTIFGTRLSRTYADNRPTQHLGFLKYSIYLFLKCICILTCTEREGRQGINVLSLTIKIFKSS